MFKFVLFCFVCFVLFYEAGTVAIWNNLIDLPSKTASDKLLRKITAQTNVVTQCELLA